MRTRLPLLLLPLAAMQLGATDCGQITRDPGFDLWCGDELCTWKTVRGEVRRAPTWHEADAGVELVGTDTAIAQLTPVTSADTDCIRFDLVANVDEGAEVILKVDVFGDGQVEREERIPTTRWQPVSFLLPMTTPYGGVRFELAKHGVGTAVLAQISAESAKGECVGLVPAPNAPAPLGSLCDSDDDCASAMCRTSVAPGAFFGVATQCVACDPDAPACGSGEVCGLDAAFSSIQYPATTCVPALSRALGEQCLSGDECESGVCTDFVCSTCSDAQPCAGGEACGAGYPALPATEDTGIPMFPPGPSVCAPGEHARTTGEPCAIDADCASGHCDGPARKQCADGRPCDSPLQCPVDGGLAPGACNVVGVQGGSCQ